MDKRFIPSQNITHARDLRIQSTEVEKRLWYRLRDRQIAGYKFRRQHPIAANIADFACEDAKLIVELDGGQHNQPEHLHRDAKRSLELEQQGWRIVRFWNHEVMENIEGVLEVIQHALTQNR
ncbi:MAG: endonuclease domain-containing protein [Rickettsiales bacterium]